MANFGICSIQDCGKPAIKRGWCQAHYRRWQRHGNPNAGRVADGAPQRFLDYAVSFNGDECLTWPYATSQSGYGRINYQGRTYVVSRLVCELTNGPAPSAKHEAAHVCGNGHVGCVNPMHLSWKTPTENQADKVAHDTHKRGERSHYAKLTEVQARAIFNDHRVYTEIAADFGISVPTVSDIKRRKSWFHIDMSPQERAEAPARSCGP